MFIYKIKCPKIGQYSLNIFFATTSYIADAHTSILYVFTNGSVCSKASQSSHFRADFFIRQIGAIRCFGVLSLFQTVHIDVCLFVHLFVGVRHFLASLRVLFVFAKIVSNDTERQGKHHNADNCTERGDYFAERRFGSEIL